MKCGSSPPMKANVLQRKSRSCFRLGRGVVFSSDPDPKLGVISMVSSGKVVGDFPSESFIFFGPVVRDVSEVAPGDGHDNFPIFWLPSPLEAAFIHPPRRRISPVR